MSYYAKVLQPGEQVRFIGKLHWIIYKNAIIYLIVAGLIALSSARYPMQDPTVIYWAAGLLAVLGVIAAMRAWFVRVTTEIVVTDKRIIHKVGWISRRTEEINITKVETVDVSQGVAARIFGYGSVLIKGIGGSWEPLRRVADPLSLRNAIIVG